MASGDSRPTRISTSDILYQHVNTGISEWLRKRFDADSRAQHKTQLSAIQSVLNSILLQLENERKNLDNADLGILYENCGRFDRRTVWLARLWQFFRHRFDQRDDREYTGVLRVADEIVWSFYRNPIEKAVALGLRSGTSPAPVPYIEAQYSPEAFPTELVPPDLRDEGEATFLLKQYLNKMPAPVVRLTPASVAAPWLVVYLAHEVGHHLQYDLLPDHRLVSEFRQLIESAVIKETNSKEEATKWGRWSREIFADMFSVVAMGPWAVRAMVELEFKSENKMKVDREIYPATAERLAMLAEICDRVWGAPSGTSALRNLFKPEDSPVRGAVLDAALGELPGLRQSMAAFYAGSPVRLAQGAARWQNVFEEKGDPDPQPDLENAPVLTAAAISAWEKVAAGTSRDALADCSRDLGERYIAKVAAGAPDDGPRGSIEEAESVVDSLAHDIIATIWQETR